jgi:hypothetical protein
MKLFVIVAVLAMLLVAMTPQAKAEECTIQVYVQNPFHKEVVAYSDEVGGMPAGSFIQSARSDMMVHLKVGQAAHLFEGGEYKIAIAAIA